MRVVFFEDVEGTAQVGDVKVVKNGFARNFLLPRGIAGPVTPPNLQRANSLAEKEARRQAKLDGEAEVHRERLEGYTVSFEARVGETGRLYGSVTSRDIAQKLEENTGIEVDSRGILLAEPIRELGSQAVTIRFTRNVSAEITVTVDPDEDSKEIVEQLMARQAEEEAAAAAAEAAAAAAAEAAAAEAEATEAAAAEAADASTPEQETEDAEPSAEETAED
ncbi:MAG: 50S ribosomal protein L9 [Dehalococcoidia bacterium]|nr:50S ribosomal protein L9 [Dehalococcoidia bacterium]